MTLFDPDDLESPPGDNGQRYRLTVAYDGTDYHGFAVNPGVPTVAGALTEALEKVLRHPIELTCAGRTDKGVHAHGQVVDFLTKADADVSGLVKSLNQLCAPAIAVRDLAPVPVDFSARFDATARRYRYTILNRPEPDPFLRHTSWHVAQPLDLDLLRLGCDPLIGDHDFSSFCRKATNAEGDEKSLRRTITSARFERDADIVTFWIEASSFCHQMVRSITGTLVEVGMRKRTAGEIRSILLAADRNAAGRVAPPQGLTLWEVRYPPGS